MWRHPQHSNDVRWQFIWLWQKSEWSTGLGKQQRCSAASPDTGSAGPFTLPSFPSTNSRISFVLHVTTCCGITRCVGMCVAQPLHGSGVSKAMSAAATHQGNATKKQAGAFVCVPVGFQEQCMHEPTPGIPTTFTLISCCCCRAYPQSMHATDPHQASQAHRLVYWHKQLANFVQGRRVISVACGAEHTLAALETGEVLDLTHCTAAVCSVLQFLLNRTNMFTT